MEEVSGVLLLWRAPADTQRGPIPSEAAFIIRPTCSIVQVITFSVALSSCEETGGGPPGRARGPEETIQIGSNRPELIQNICSSKKGNNNFLKKNEERKKEKAFLVQLKLRPASFPHPHTFTLIHQINLVVLSTSEAFVSPAFLFTSATGGEVLFLYFVDGPRFISA